MGNRLPLLILSAILIVAFCGCRDEYRDPSLQKELNDYFQGLLDGRQQVAIEKMDPRFFPNEETKQEAIRMCNELTTGFVYHSLTNQTPFGYFEESNSVHCFVPYIANATIKGQTATIKAYLLATRYQGSNTWYFVAVGTDSQNQRLATNYPNLPKKLPRGSRIN